MALPTYKTFIANLEPTESPPEASEDECEICYFPFTQPIRLPCSHVFCKECLVRSLIPRNFCSKCRHVLFQKRPFDHTKDEGRYDERTPVPPERYPRPRPMASENLDRALSEIVQEPHQQDKRERPAALRAEERLTVARPRRERWTNVPVAPPIDWSEAVTGARARAAENRETRPVPSGLSDRLRDGVPRPTSRTMRSRPSRGRGGLSGPPALSMPDIDVQPRDSVPSLFSDRSPLPSRESRYARMVLPRRHLEERREELSMSNVDSPSPPSSATMAPLPPRARASRYSQMAMPDIDAGPTSGIPPPSLSGTMALQPLREGESPPQRDWFTSALLAIVREDRLSRDGISRAEDSLAGVAEGSGPGDQVAGGEGPGDQAAGGEESDEGYHGSTGL